MFLPAYLRNAALLSVFLLIVTAMLAWFPNGGNEVAAARHPAQSDEQVKPAQSNEQSKNEQNKQTSTLPSLAAKEIAPQIRKEDGERQPIFTVQPDSWEEERESSPQRRSFKVSSGNTLAELMAGVGVGASEAHAAIQAFSKVFKPRDLMPGHEFIITFDTANPPKIKSIFFQPDPLREITIARLENGAFKGEEVKRKLTPTLVKAQGNIDSSLFEAATQVGVPSRVLAEMIRIFSYDVDFQRDIHPGDKFEVMFERYHDDEGRLARDADPIYVKMVLSGNSLAFYRHKLPNGDVDYYNAKGETVRKALLRTPIDGAKLTSKFGNRHHPILGFTTMHKGVDFGAPIGTPIQAAGDGTVEFAGSSGAYGLYIRLRHNSTYSTAYAHMSRLGRSMKSGVKVRQGQIIGYVGNTGRSTGPHLHYEVLVNKAQINPLSIKVPAGVRLAGNELNQFIASLGAIDAKLLTADLLVNKNQKFVDIKRR